MMKTKKVFLILTAAIMMMFASFALPVLADEDNTTAYEDTGDTIPEPIAAPDTQPQDAAPVGAPSDGTQTKSGVSFGTVFAMFVLGVLINAGISFVIGNRFYRLSKKDSHIQSEIRALRRDINEKFGGSVTEIKEKAATVKNANKNYSRDGGITYKEEKPSEELSEISKRWNINVSEAADPEVTIRTARRSGAAGNKRQDPRRASGRSRGGIDADEDVSDSVKNKAKKFLGDIFPFEDE